LAVPRLEDIGYKGRGYGDVNKSELIREHQHDVISHDPLKIAPTPKYYKVHERKRFIFSILYLDIMRSINIIMLSLLFAAVFICGCIQSETATQATDQPESTETAAPIEKQRSTFEITGWKISGADSFVSLIYDYSSTKPSNTYGDLEISLIGPEENLLGTEYKSAGWSDWGSLHMTSGSYAVPPSGTYKIVVKDDIGVIFEKDLTLSEANVSILRVSPKWYYSEYWGNSLDYACIELLNEGDIPACIGKMPISVGDEEVTGGVGLMDTEGYVKSGWLEHGNETFCVTGYSNVWVGGENILHLAVYNRSGFLIAKNDMEISLPYKTK